MLESKVGNKRERASCLWHQEISTLWLPPPLSHIPASTPPPDSAAFHTWMSSPVMLLSTGKSTGGVIYDLASYPFRVICSYTKVEQKIKDERTLVFAVTCGGRSKVDRVWSGMRLTQCIHVGDVWHFRHEKVLSIQNKCKQKFKRKKCKESKERQFGEKMQPTGEDSTASILPQSSFFISSFCAQNAPLE